MVSNYPKKIVTVKTKPELKVFMYWWTETDFPVYCHKQKFSWPDVYFKGSTSQNIKGVTIYIFVTSFSNLANFIRIQHFGSKTISGLRNTNKHLFWYIRVRSWIFCIIFNENIKGNVIVESGRHWEFVFRHLIFNTQTNCHFNEKP